MNPQHFIPSSLEQNPTSTWMVFKGKLFVIIAVNTAANSLGDRPDVKYFSVTHERMLTVVKKFYKATQLINILK